MGTHQMEILLCVQVFHCERKNTINKHGRGGERNSNEDRKMGRETETKTEKEGRNRNKTERWGEKQKQRQKDGERNKQRQRSKETGRENETEMQRLMGRLSLGETEREISEIQRHTESETVRQREKDTHTQ